MATIHSNKKYEAPNIVWNFVEGAELSGKTIFYDIYSDAEKTATPKKRIQVRRFFGLNLKRHIPQTIVPFNTHGGSGFLNTIAPIAELEPNSTIKW